MPACCGLITMGFGVFFCKIEVFEPPIGGGGGGSFAVEPGIYVPWPKAPGKRAKTVLVTVKFAENKTWRKAYTLDENKANGLVRAIDFTNATARRLSVGVQGLKRAARRVSAVFTRNNDK